MVISRISTAVAYPELSRLEVGDVGHESDAYELEIMGMAVYIAMGRADFAFKRQHNIVFYPVYLIHKTSHDVIRKIAILEFPADDVSYLNDTGGVNLEARPFAPLLFAHVNEAVLEQSTAENPNAQPAQPARKRKGNKGKGKGAIDTPAEIDKVVANTDAVVPANAPEVAASAVAVDTDEDVVEDDADEVLAGESAGTGGDVELPTQTKELASMEKSQYAQHPKKTSTSASANASAKEPWIQTFMHNKNFGIVDNVGGTDSLFATIRDGLRSQGRDVSIEEMRTKLSDLATKELYTEYVDHFNKLATPFKRLRAEIREYDQKLAAIMERKTQSQDRGQRLSASELLKLESEHKDLRAQRDELMTKTLHVQRAIESRYAYMKEARDYDRFKVILKTRSFIPDAWALRALERVYNINLIRLSAPRFESGDLDNVIICGDELADAPGLGSAMFKERYHPLLFIMTSVDEHGNYRLITYRAKGSLSFAEVPYDVRIHIITKCMEDAGGEYAFIPQFKQQMVSAPASMHGGGGGGSGIKNPKSSSSSSSSSSFSTSATGSHNDVPILQFYNRAGSEFPGRGAGEYMPSSAEHLFVPLSKIPNWRRALSNFAESPFILDGRTWFSVEHYYQGSKFRKQNRDFYMQFSLDSGSDIAKDPLIAKAAGSKSGTFKGRLYRPKAVAVDSDFFSSGQSQQSVADAMEAKFRQNSDMKQILLATLNAQLYHFQRGEKPILFSNLMQLREKL